MSFCERLRDAYETLRRELLAERGPDGHWVGELSSSSLSTATATSALAAVLKYSRSARPDAESLERLIRRAVLCLVCSQNPDGGWGDTDKSTSNIATTMLVQAAFHLAGVAGQHEEILASAQRFIDSRGGLAGLRNRYGADKTFAVPILSNYALAGLVPWSEVEPLPFEMACLPHAALGVLRLPVVSYAIPALVAIGQARYFHGKPLNPVTRVVRRLAVDKSLAVLRHKQPASGGFLEATPLTSFVVMNLAGIGRTEHPVVERGVEFLVASAREDGSWPIDTNLATWTTTLAINALAAGAEDVGWLGCLDWLLDCQHQEVHPFTSTEPGGWGWTDLSGAVPDADDTAGALLALATLRGESLAADVPRIDEAARLGFRWLLSLQNRDGGWPTFCRGWGALPFDRSGVDLTAHALRALYAWTKTAPLVFVDWDRTARLGRRSTAARTGERVTQVFRRGLAFLERQQRADGSWTPLWFGEQFHPAEENPVYGTARTLLAYRDLDLMASDPAQRGLRWLAGQQNADGGWGMGPGGRDGQPSQASCVEQTAVAVEALLGAEGELAVEPVVAKGLAWLAQTVESGRHRETTPIGLYFAKLWYYERLYPLCFAVSALGQALRRLAPRPPTTV